MAVYTTLDFVEGEGISVQLHPDPSDPATLAIEIASTVTAGAEVTAAAGIWMPLTSTVAGDDVLVFDANHSLIPTLVTL